MLSFLNRVKVNEDEIDRVAPDCEEEWMDIYLRSTYRNG